MNSACRSAPAAAGLRLFLALVMGLLLITGGCRSAAPAAATPSALPEAAPPAHTAAAPRPAAPTAAPAPSLTPTLEAPAPTPLPWIEDPVVWVVPGDPQPELPMVNQKLNEALAERGLNMRVEIRMIEPVRYEPELRTLWEAGMPPDLVTTGHRGYLSYREAVEAGWLLALSAYPNPLTGELEDLVAQAPALQNALPAAAWQAARTNGQIYGVPGQQVWARPWGVAVRTDVLEALDLREALDAARTFEDLTPIFDAIRKAVAAGTLQKNASVQHGDRIRGVFAHANLLRPEIAGYEMPAPFLVVRHDDASGEVVQWLRTPEFRRLAELRRSWQEAGFAPSAPLPPDRAAAGLRDGQYAVEVARPVAPGAGGEVERHGYRWVEKALASPFLSTGDVTAVMTSVSAQAGADPERLHRVMRLLELMHTDAALFNLAARGVEGVHWRWTGSGDDAIRLVEESGYQLETGAYFGSLALAYPLAGDASGLSLSEWNRQASASALLGFEFDPRPVAAQYAQLQAAGLELLGPLSSGQAARVEAAMDGLDLALQEAGLENVELELRRQLASWRGAR